MAMEIKYLRLVKSIVEQGSMAKAKERLYLTQSALSHQLKEAENRAGTALFERVGKQLILTPAGELVYETANEVLEKVENLDRDIRYLYNGEKGLVRICTACFTNYLWLPDLVKRFEQVHPNVEIKICPEYINDCVDRLQKHDIDAIIMNKPEPMKNVRYIELSKDEMVAIFPKNHEWNNKEYLKAVDFESKNLIIFSKPLSTVVVYTKVLEPAGIKPPRIFEVPMTEAMVEMVASGLGVAVIPHWIAQPYINDGKISAVRVTPKGLFRSLGVAIHQKESYPEYFETLIAYLKERLGEDHKSTELY